MGKVFHLFYKTRLKIKCCPQIKTIKYLKLIFFAKMQHMGLFKAICWSFGWCHPTNKTIVWSAVTKSNLMSFVFLFYLLFQAETKFYNGLLYYGEGGKLLPLEFIPDLDCNTLIVIIINWCCWCYIINWYKDATAHFCHSFWHQYCWRRVADSNGQIHLIPSGI